MSDDAGMERKAYWGERLAIVMRYVRSGQEISKWDAELLVSEIDRLRERLQDSRQAQQRMLEIIRDAYAGLGREVSGASQDREEIERLMAERDKWRREADMAQAARNVALDKLVRIARIVSPDDFEEADA
jgi:hypothetical protein